MLPCSTMNFAQYSQLLHHPLLVPKQSILCSLFISSTSFLCLCQTCRNLGHVPGLLTWLAANRPSVHVLVATCNLVLECCALARHMRPLQQQQYHSLLKKWPTSQSSTRMRKVLKLSIYYFCKASNNAKLDKCHRLKMDDISSSRTCMVVRETNS